MVFLNVLNYSKQIERHKYSLMCPVPLKMKSVSLVSVQSISLKSSFCGDMYWTMPSLQAFVLQKSETKMNKLRFSIIRSERRRGAICQGALVNHFFFSINQITYKFGTFAFKIIYILKKKYQTRRGFEPSSLTDRRSNWYSSTLIELRVLLLMNYF